MSDWDKFYHELRGARYPYDVVVSVVNRLYPNGGYGLDALDVGCGIGNHLIFLSEFGFSVYGIDSCKEAVKACMTQYLPLVDKRNIEVADICNTDFEDESFDFVLDRSCITYVQSKKIAIDEVLRILKPGGYFLSVMYSYDSLVGNNDITADDCIDSDSLIDLFRGFESVQISKQISAPMVNDDIIPKYNQYVILARKK